MCSKEELWQETAGSDDTVPRYNGIKKIEWTISEWMNAWP